MAEEVKNMEQKQFNALIEAVKEVGRYSVFLALTTFVSLLIERFTQMPQDNLLIIALTLALRAIDKYLHEERKDVGYNLGQPRGLLPF